RQISTLVQSGMPLEECLKAVSDQAEKPRIRGMLAAVRATVEHKAKVLTTNRALAKGSFIERESLVWKEVSLAERESLGEVFLQPVFELDQIAGSVAVQFFSAGSGLSPEMLFRSGRAAWRG
ncbi:hypothetical protein JS84_25250, partial [Vibrio vulnificus]|uniref:type II secretion system F family protein n=1 Tax=Vibrio vulnificus TaxID=672 RepID=UPI0004FF9CC1